MIGTRAQPNKPTTTTTRIAPFAPLPWQVEPWRDRSPIVLLTGAAGGGKSRLAGEKVHAYCLKYPGSTALITRKAKTSMSGGSILFMRRKVVGNDPHVRWVDSPKFRFEYDNGSILQFIGLLDENARDNLKSIGQDGAVDISWFEEGTQFEEEDLNAMSARMRGKAAPWRQILITTNPDAPLHWIKRRLIDGGEARVYYSSAADNFHNPADYAAWLSTLSGIDHQRLVLGQWVQASGLIFDTWADPGTVDPAAEYVPNGGPVFWAVDDGYSAGSAQATAGKDPKTGYYVADSHPRVILWVQQRDDGRLVVFDEDYACQKLSDQHIADVLAAGPETPDLAVHGPGAAEIRGRLFAAGVAPMQSTANVEESTKELRRRLAPDANGWRAILVHPRCVQLRAEMASYRADPATGKPIKQFDHGPDALRGLVHVLRNQ